MAANPEMAPAMSDDDVASQIAQLPASLLAFEDEERDMKQAANPETEPATEEATEETTDDGDAEEVDPDAEVDPDETQPQESDEDPIFEVTLPGGVKTEIPLSELAAGYSKNEDYKAKTAQLAEQRREFEQERQTKLSGVQTYEQQLKQTLEFYRSINPLGDEPSDEMLNINSPQYNPDQYHWQKSQYEKRARELGLTAQRLQYIQEQEVQRQKDTLEATTKQESAKLKEVWPELYDADGTKATAARTNLMNGLQEHFGIDAATVSTVLDHRFYLLAKAALEYKAIHKEAPKVTARLKGKPTVVKPGTRTQAKSGQKQFTDKMANLRKTGSDEAAMALFGDLIDRGL